MREQDHIVGQYRITWQYWEYRVNALIDELHETYELMGEDTAPIDRALAESMLEDPDGERFDLSDAGVTLVDGIDNPPIETFAVTYHAWTDGHAVGFRCVFRDGRPDEYIYLNPSIDEAEEDSPDCFLYMGPQGDPDLDVPQHFYIIGERDAYAEADAVPTTGATSRADR
jgi:hypothetical protein